eukprot:TRINITY_DN49023_c0_g2_i1.p1 TRINITY_DN49023_c0_g2~~TRINITY_DN49023_c0_g2_i1.p1  ORF type:complete len:654 (+),score=94.00 TRINITY_DN49023_c0_g2_i1:93-2054(+)
MWADLMPDAYVFFTVLGINVICIMLYSYLFLRPALSGKSRLVDVIMALVFATWQQCRNEMYSWWSPRAAGEQKVRRLAEQERLHRGQRLGQIGAHLFAAASIVRIVAVLYTHGMSFQDVDFAKLLVPFVQLTLGFCLCLLVSASQSALKAVIFDVCHLLAIGRIVWEFFLCPDALLLLARQEINIGARFIFAFFVGRPSVTFGLNALCAVAKCCRYVALLASVNPEDAELVTNVYGEPAAVVQTEAFLCGAVLVVSTVVQLWTRTTVRSRLEAKSASKSEVTIKALLSVVCNAVVTVTEDLVLSTPSMQLAHFLLRQPLHNSYEGVSLLDFVVEDDRERVEKQITSSSTSPGAPLSVSTKLVDANGSPVDVRMYCISILDDDSCRSFFIGIVESKEDEQLEVGADICMPLATTKERLPAARGSDSRPPDDAASDGFSESSAYSLASTVLPTDAASGVLEALVDIAHAQLPIMQASSSMSQLVGPTEAGLGKLRDWFSGNKGSEAVAALTEAFEAYVMNPRSSPPKVSLGKLRLAPPHARLAGLRYTATVSVDFTGVHEAYAATRRRPVALRFEDVKAFKARESSRRSGRVSRSRSPPGAASASSWQEPESSPDCHITVAVVPPDAAVEDSNSVEGLPQPPLWASGTVRLEVDL